MYEQKMAERFKIFLLVLGIVFILFLSFIAVINILDLKVDLFNLNPSDQPQIKTIELFYPPNSQEKLNVVAPDDATKITNPAQFSVTIFLKYDGILTEGSKVNVSAAGFIYPDGENVVGTLRNIQTNEIGKIVSINFEGASIYDEKSPYEPITGLDLTTKLHSIPMRAGYNSSDISKLPILPSITWDNQGDFEPSITFASKNFTTTTISYPNYKIHVSGSDVKRQERYARIQTSLTIALFFFAIITSIGVLVPLIPKSLLKKFGFEEIESSSENSNDNNSDNTELTIKTDQQPSKIPHISDTKSKKKHR